MSTTIRLSRMGKKHQPLYRVVVKTTRDRRDGKYIEEVGFYNPGTNPSTFTLKKDRIKYWLEKGSQISPIVKKLYEKTA